MRKTIKFAQGSWKALQLGNRKQFGSNAELNAWLDAQGYEWDARNFEWCPKPPRSAARDGERPT